MALVAVLSNPESDGNRSRLDRLRAYCADRADILHVEVQRSEDIGITLNRVAVERPEVLVVNGGDGTVQAVLTELYGEGAPDRALPPIAVLPSGKTNLIAKDLGSTGDPVRALERVIRLAREGVCANVVNRQLIALDTGSGERPVLGMFLAAGALADILLFCRHKLYPLGLPNGLAHFLTVIAGLTSVLTDWSARFLPPKPPEVGLGVGRQRLRGRFQVVMVTTLRRLVLTGRAPAEREGTLQLLAVERRRRTVLRMVAAASTGRLGATDIPGVHLKAGDSIRIEDEGANVIMDGEHFTAAPGKPILLRPTRHVRFLDLGHGARVPEARSGEMPGFAPGKPRPAHASALSDVG